MIVDALREWLLVDQEVGVLFIDFEKYAHIEDYYGWEVFDDVLREASRALKRLLGTLFSTEDLIAINRPSGSEFYVFLSVPPGLRGDEILERLQRKARQIEESLTDDAEREVPEPHPAEDRALTSATSKLLYSPQVRLERLVYRALREAISDRLDEGRRARGAPAGAVQGRPRAPADRDRSTSRSSTSRRAASSRTRLSRAARPSLPFENPEVLFDYALKSDQVWSLEKICMQFSAERFARQARRACCS